MAGTRHRETHSDVPQGVRAATTFDVGPLREPLTHQFANRLRLGKGQCGYDQFPLGGALTEKPRWVKVATVRYKKFRTLSSDIT
jgi:hypothetical protein